MEVKLKFNQKFTAEEIQQILHDLRGSDQSVEVAFVEYKDTIYYSHYRPIPHCPSSASVKLIQGIFDQNQDLSFFILRQRIYTTEEISTLVRGVVKLTAKRISQVKAMDHKMTISYSLRQIGMKDEAIYHCQALAVEPEYKIPARILSHQQGIHTVLEMAQAVPRGLAYHDMNRPIAALLINAEGKSLGWSTNSAIFNKTLHAELRMTQKFFQKFKTGFPPGSRIYVSLKPCQMCAGVLEHCAEDPNSLEIIYAEDDPGTMARHLILQNQTKKIGAIT